MNNLRPIWLALTLALAALAVAVLQGTTSLEQAQLAARYTARVAFPLFLLPYCARPLVKLWRAPWSQALRRQRRQWGLAFALAHTVHLFALATYITWSGEAPPLTALVFGGISYLLMFIMAFTSTNAAQRAMGVWWRRIHTLGMHWMWLVFVVTYIGHLSDPSKQAYGALALALAFSALGLRLLAAIRGRTAA